jgi:SAM-dependent methyltransferase
MADAFGRALLAYLRGSTAVHIIERDDGHLDEIETASYFREFNEWERHEQEAIPEARGRVLDVGCGAGREALRLQEMGLDVVGIDLSPLALEVSRKRGVRDCRLMDLRKLEFPDGYFDTVVMFGNNLGIAGDVEQCRSAFRGLHRVTGEDAVIIASSRDPLKTDHPAHLSYHERNRRRGRPPGLVRIRIGFEGEFDDWFEFLMVGPEKLQELLEPTGWAHEKTYACGGANYTAILRKA